MLYPLLALASLAVALPSPHDVNQQIMHRHYRRAAGAKRSSADSCYGSAVNSTQAYVASTAQTRLSNPKASSVSASARTLISSPAPSSAASAPISTSTSNSAIVKKQLAGSYFTDWNADIFPPEQIDYSKFDIIYYAFGVPDQYGNVNLGQSDSGDTITRLVKLAHANNVKVLLSVGGWSGSVYFSTLCANVNSRKTLVSNIMKLVYQFNLDGIDIDWEYPNSQANSANTYSNSDSANFALFLRLLRSKLTNSRLLTAAVALAPFNGPNGSPLSDVTSLVQYLDHILLMNYDVWGASSNPGPNAPLSNACPNSAQPNANAKAGIDAWNRAGVPLSKIHLGLPSYGYVSWSSATTLVHKRDTLASFHERQVEAGRERRLAKRAAESTLKPYMITTIYRENGESITYCPDNHGGNCGSTTTKATSTSRSTKVKSSSIASSMQPKSKSGSKITTSAPSTFTTSGQSKFTGNGDLSSYGNSQIGFNKLIELGALYENYQGLFKPRNGYTRKWDKCSSTPYLYNQARNVVVTYDDPTSIYAKSRYAQGRHIGGFAFWEMSLDYNYVLMNAARSGFLLT